MQSLTVKYVKADFLRRLERGLATAGIPPMQKYKITHDGVDYLGVQFEPTGSMNLFDPENGIEGTVKTGPEMVLISAAAASDNWGGLFDRTGYIARPGEFTIEYLGPFSSGERALMNAALDDVLGPEDRTDCDCPACTAPDKDLN